MQFDIRRSVFGLILVPNLAQGYVVQGGDTLSEIAETHLEGKVYGPKGNLAKLKALNPKLKKDPNFILPGQKIILQEPRPVFSPQVTNSEVEAKVLEETPKAEKSAFLAEKSLIFFPLLKFAQFKGKVRSSGDSYSFTSMPSVGFQLAWIEKFSDQFSLAYSFQYQSYRFMVPEDTILLNATTSEESLGVGLTYQFSEKWSFINDLSYESIVYLNPIESGQVSLDKSNTFVNRARVSYRFSQAGSLENSVYGGWAYSLANSAKSFKADANSGLFAGIQARSGLRDTNVGIVSSFEYSKEGRNTSTMNQGLEDYTLGLGINWKF